MLSIKTNNTTVFLEGEMGEFSASLNSFYENDNLEFITLKLSCDKATIPSKMKLTWTYPIKDIHAQWNPAIGYNRGLVPDWSWGFKSKSTSGAPVHCLYNYNGENRLTFALSDAMNSLNIKCGVNEESAFFKCSTELFVEPMAPITEYEVILRLDTRDIPYYESLKEVSKWWASLSSYIPATIPETAKLPMYSTWYSFHQLIDTVKILEQCKIAKELGCETVIVDDGWQTEDNHRGYAYCGDWEVAGKKVANMKNFVEDVHKIGMKIMIWYSVPFVGKCSKAWNKFKGKFLDSESNDWCILDPRFPEVREYLISIYENAVRDWDLDGLKLDFVDNFNLTEHSKDSFGAGRDYDSVSLAVDRLLKDSLRRLQTMKQDFMIEFRQSYIGPLMRSYGNMFRAGDCPNDSLGNRLRTLDIRLLCGSTATHSDMLMWNYEESIESAAMQFINVLFSVPQVSVLLDKIPEKHYKMVKYMLKFWVENKDVLLDGNLMPLHPEANYTTVFATNLKKMIAVTYSSTVIKLPENTYKEIIFINGTYEKELIVNMPKEYANASYVVYNCCGDQVSSGNIDISLGINSLQIPTAGIFILTP